MNIHYNAFISYRHHPEDIKVATQIHRALERFHVPKALRKTAKLPMHLFRDKDELPITSNLSDDIFDALKNSDYLIVICSTHTKESIWVQREIETFLKFHPRNKILTVLVNGEPCDVIPEILLNEEITDPETGEKKVIPVEPLSCDWRMGHRKAIREELPRLAAPLLHCAYDELRQRQRQYRMKRLIAFFSIALTVSMALAAYFLYTSITIRNANIQIQANLEEAQRNQSQHLATASQDALEDNDRFTAIALALAALPSDTDPRPYVASAEHALSAALDVYSTGSTLAATGALVPSNVVTVTDFAVNDNQSVIYLLDNRDVITAWDPITLDRLGSIAVEEYFFGDMGVSASGNLIITQQIETTDVLQCFAPDGTLIWQRDNCCDYLFLNDCSILMAMQWADRRASILYLDPDTGKEVRDARLLPDTNDSYCNFSFLRQEYNDSMPLVLEYSNFSEYVLFCVNDSNELSPVYTNEDMFFHAKVLENGLVISLVSDGSGVWNGNYGGSISTGPARCVIYCHDPITGQLLWESEIITYVYTSEFHILPIPESSRLLVQAGNTLQLMDITNGEIQQICESTATIMTLEAYKTYAMGVQQDGAIVHYSYEDNGCTSFDFNMEGNLRQAYMNQGYYYTLQMNDCQVTAYQYVYPNYLWKDTDNGYVYIRSFRQHDNLIAINSRDQLLMYDLQSQSYLWTIPNDGCSLLSFTEDGTKLIIQNSDYALVLYDALTGHSTPITVTDTEGNLVTSMPYQPEIQNDCAWFLDQTQGRLRLHWIDLHSGIQYGHTFLRYEDVDPETAEAYFAFIEKYKATPEDSRAPLDDALWTFVSDMVDAMYPYEEDAAIVYATRSYAWVKDGLGTVYELDLAAGTSTILRDEFDQPTLAAFRESDTLAAISFGNEIQLKYPGAEAHIRILLDEENQPGSLYFHEDTLFVLCDSGCIQRFDLEGNLLSRTELTVSSNFTSNLYSELNEPTDIVWNFTDDGKLIFLAFDLANIIECETWSARGYVANCVTYYEGDNIFLRSDDAGLAALPCYETEELIQLGKDTLGGFTLTPDQKNSYGLD